MKLQSHNLSLDRTDDCVSLISRAKITGNVNNVSNHPRPQGYDILSTAKLNTTILMRCYTSTVVNRERGDNLLQVGSNPKGTHKTGKLLSSLMFNRTNTNRVAPIGFAIANCSIISTGAVL